MLFLSPVSSSKLFVPGLKTLTTCKRFHWEEDFDLTIAMECRYHDSLAIKDPEPEVTFAEDEQRNEKSLKKMRSLVNEYENNWSKVSEVSMYSFSNDSDLMLMQNCCNGYADAESIMIDEMLCEDSVEDFLEGMCF
ncbi:hypothetical protein IHE45_16G009000 [Dioscorea alata]|uniref:Uncharacterized protein n=1 Tax=Dioscorea alata TaxID=55571 RepID=A0ACB7UFK2_DIOAL|nr:hypothetical protein IHE45_16G009000 [Dioscorea alata]